VVKGYTLVVNTEDCVGCHACEIACKQEHNLPVGPRWIKVHSDGYEAIGGKLQIGYNVKYCIQCSPAPCQDACTVGAISKREDGLVLIDERLCTGCKDCIEACPLGVMEFDNGRGVAQKCNLCVERIDRGLQPACVIACPSHCISVGHIAGVTKR
jgi:Fe-S-cluster-containing dehydrogenase component